MKKMKGKKKWFAALLTLCLLISLIPMSVFADGVTDDIVPGSNYKHTYHTKISATANVTIKDADGNVVETATVKKSSDDFMEGNLSDKNVQNEITRICDEIETQYSSRGTVTIEKRNGQMVFDHFESSNVINSENNTVNKDLDIHEYQVYELSYDITVQEPQADDTVITTVDVGNVWKTLEADKEVVYTGEVNPNSECANQMELVMEGWQENAIDGWTLRSTRKDDKPKAGSEYYYFVELKAKDGYVFPKDMHTLSNVICDGKTYTSWGGSSSDDGKSATIYFYDIAVTATDNTVTDNAIKNVEISEATTTYAVGNCPYDYAYPSGENASKYKLVYTHWEEMEERDGELVPVRHWYSDTKENENLPENQKFDEFKSNTKYMYSIKLEAINGNTFATTDEGLSVTVNCKDGSSI